VSDAIVLLLGTSNDFNMEIYDRPAFPSISSVMAHQSLGAESLLDFRSAEPYFSYREKL